MHIGICGAQGSFSEEAGMRYVAQHNVTNADIVPLVTAERVLSAVEAGEVDRGIMPIENSNGGVVIEAVYAMAAHRFSIEAMFEIDVHHNLLVVPGTTADAVTCISSHDQALKQCRQYLKRTWPAVEVTEYADTAQAAADLAGGILPPYTAVIAPKRCADLYGLEVLAESVQDLKYNYTMFIVATK